MRKLAFIKGFGFEIEGGWEAKRREEYSLQRLMKGDGSVRMTKTVPGEINSPVFKDLKMAWEFMKEYYPDEMNSSCGFHVHISVKENDYIRLMEPEFHKTFKKWSAELWKKHHNRIPPEYETRREGKNRYCQDKFQPERQVTGGGDRYTQLNYCYSQHATLENRMFPGCPDAKTAYFLMTQYLFMIEKFLKNAPNKKAEHKIEVMMPPIKTCTPVQITENIGEIICAS